MGSNGSRSFSRTAARYLLQVCLIVLVVMVVGVLVGLPREHSVTKPLLKLCVVMVVGVLVGLPLCLDFDKLSDEKWI